MTFPATASVRIDTRHPDILEPVITIEYKVPWHRGFLPWIARFYLDTDKTSSAREQLENLAQVDEQQDEVVFELPLPTHDPLSSQAIQGVSVSLEKPDWDDLLEDLSRVAQQFGGS